MNTRFVLLAGAAAFTTGVLAPDWAAALSCIEPTTTLELLADGTDLSAYVPEGKKACIIATPGNIEIVPCDDPVRFGGEWSKLAQP